MTTSFKSISELFAEGGIDAETLSKFMSLPASELVPRRLAPDIHSLNHYLNYLNALKAFYTQSSGTVTVDGQVIKSVGQIVKDAEAETSAATTAIHATLETAAMSNSIIPVDSLIKTVPTDPNAFQETQAIKNRRLVSLSEYKAPSVAWDVALKNALSIGNREVDGNHQTIAIDKMVTCTTDNLTLKNLTIDITAILRPPGKNIDAITFKGSEGLPMTLTADTLHHTNMVTVADASSFAIGDWVWLSCDALFVDTEGHLLATGLVSSDFATLTTSQSARVKKITGNTLYLYEDVMYNFKVSDNAKILRLDLLKNLRLQNVKVIGSGRDSQLAIVLDRCLNTRIDNIATDKAAYVGLMMRRCINTVVNEPQFYDAQAAGLSYGIAITDGCTNTTINNPYGQDLRHLITIGGARGINHFTQVYNIAAKGMRDAGFDSHSAANFITAEGGFVECAPEVTARDGLISQGANTVFSDIQVIGAYFRAAVVENHCASGQENAADIHNIMVTDTYRALSSAETNILVINKGKGKLNGVNLSGINADGIASNAINIVAANTGGIENISINGNPKLHAVGTAISVYTRMPALIKNITIGLSNVHGEVGQAMFFDSQFTPIENVIVMGNNIDTYSATGGGYSIRLRGVNGFKEYGNICTGYGRERVLVMDGCSNICIDNSDADIVDVSAVVRYTVNYVTKYIIMSNNVNPVEFTLPDATAVKGHEIVIKSNSTKASSSKTANIVKATGGVPSTVILEGGIGNWVKLKSNGLNWVVLEGYTYVAPPVAV